jgi:hypothetical protein
MPAWVIYIIGTAAVVTAIGVLWTKVIKPAAKLITTTDQMLPLLVALTETFKNNPTGFKVLNEIAAQFKTDSGSSLRDVVNRLEEGAKENRAAADLLKVGVEAQKQLGEQDREQLRQLLISLDRVGVKVDAGAATGLRNEAAAKVVASNLASQRDEE